MNLIIGFLFLALAITILVVGDTSNTADAVAFYGNLIIANIYFAATS